MALICPRGKDQNKRRKEQQNSFTLPSKRLKREQKKLLSLLCFSPVERRERESESTCWQNLLQITRKSSSCMSALPPLPSSGVHTPPPPLHLSALSFYMEASLKNETKHQSFLFLSVVFLGFLLLRLLSTSRSLDMTRQYVSCVVYVHHRCTCA